MSQFYVPGPTNIQVGTGTSGALEFLGFTEDNVRVSPNARFEEVRADYAGTQLPADLSFQGFEAYITADLSSYNEGILAKVMARLNGLTEGLIAANQIGTLVFQEGFAFRLLLKCMYSAKAGYETMRPAYNFLTAVPFDSFDVSLNTRTKRPRVVFRALAVINKTNLTGTLYNSDVTGAVSPD